MEAPAGATSLAKLEVGGVDPTKPLPFGYANEFTVIFSDVHNCESGRSVESKEIISGPFKWRVWLYPRGVGEGEGSHVSVFLSPTEYSHRPTWFRMSILGLRGEDPIVQDAIHNMGELQRQGFSAWGTRKFSPIAACFGAERGYYVNNKLHVRVQYMVERGLTKKEMEIPPCFESELSRKEPLIFPPFYETGLSSLLSIEYSEELAQDLVLERHIDSDTTDVERLKLSPRQPRVFSIKLHPSVLKLIGFEEKEGSDPNYHKMIDTLASSPLPTRSIFGFVAVLYGATLKLADPISMDNIVLLCHVIHLLRIFEVDSHNQVYQLRHALFYAPSHSLDTGKILAMIWTDCKDTKVLLEVLIPFLRMEQAQFEAASISLESHLCGRMSSYTSLSKAIYDRNYVPPCDLQSFKLAGLRATLLQIGTSLKVEATTPESSSCSKEMFQIRSKKRSGGGTPRGNGDEDEIWTVKVATEILFARWPYFRRLINSRLSESASRSVNLPFSKEVLLEIVRELCTDGNSKSNRLALPDSECMDVLIDGREFELYSDLDDFKVGEAQIDVEKALRQGIFGRLVQHCVNSVFSKEYSKNTLVQLQRAHTLQWKTRTDEIATYIGSNFKSVFADSSNKKKLKELPQELRLLILDSHVQHL